MAKLTAYMKKQLDTSSAQVLPSWQLTSCKAGAAVHFRHKALYSTGLHGLSLWMVEAS